MPNGQFQLTPDVIGSLARGTQFGQQIQQIRQQPQIQLLRQQALQGDPQALQQLAAIDPQAGQQVQAFQQNKFNLATAEEKQKITSVARAALQVQALPTPEAKIEFLESRREELALANIPTQETDEALNLYKAGQVDQANQLVDQMVNIGQAVGVLERPPAPQIKKIGDRFVTVTPEGVTEIPGQEGIEIPTELSEVQSSKILEGGAVQIVRKDGTVEVKAPDEVQADIVRRAEERGVDLQQRRAQGRGLGKEAAKVAGEVFKRVGTLRANNRTLRKVVQEVAAGAETGPLAARLPSMREASIKLDRLRSELGLDVVGSVTFGALSEGELNLALSTALPTTLEGPALSKWASDKIEAQEKLIGYLEDQAIFLSDKGNTPADWLKLQREQAEQAETSPEITTTAPAGAPQTIRFDRQGNRL